jgi:Uma2 family endonuclease
MVVEPRLTSAAEFERLPSDSQRRELVRGELRTTTPGGDTEKLLADRFSRSLRDYVTAHELGDVLVNDPGFLLTVDPDTVRTPAVAFIRRARCHPGGRVGAFWPGPPDMAVEVVSPNDLYEDVFDRVADYLAHGSQLVFIVNPQRRSIAAHGPGPLAPVYAAADVLDAGDVLPGWRLPLRDLFRQP